MRRDRFLFLWDLIVSSSVLLLVCKDIANSWRSCLLSFLYCADPYTMKRKRRWSTEGFRDPFSLSLVLPARRERVACSMRPCVLVCYCKYLTESCCIMGCWLRTPFAFAFNPFVLLPATRLCDVLFCLFLSLLFASLRTTHNDALARRVRFHAAAALMMVLSSTRRPI